MGKYEERYGSILENIAKGKGELTGLTAPAQGVPRYQYSTHDVALRKGGMLSKGGASESDMLLRDIMLDDGWEIAGVESHPEYIRFHLQRRHEPNCQCADCADWKQFRARLQP